MPYGIKNPHPVLGRYVVPDMPSADELLPYLRQIDANRWYSNFGPMVTQFEQRMQALLAAPSKSELHLTTVMSCYHALQIGLQLFHLPPRANVLVPAVTFPACPLAVQHAGAVPVLVDVDIDTWQLTPKTARRVAERMPAHAVMPVAVYGVPVPAAEWDKFTDDTGIPVIIDAAAALEAQPIPEKCLVAYSLHATKPFSVGEGGILVSRNAEQIEEARRISNFGTQMRIATQDGSNAKMSEYHGAVGQAQLDRWVGVKARRRKVFDMYHAALDKSGLGVSVQKGFEQTVVSAFMLQTEEFSAANIVDELTANGIAAHRMYLPPLYHHPHFAGLKTVNTEGLSQPGQTPALQKAALMANSEIMHASVFGVPFHAFMSQDDVDDVIQKLALATEKPPAKIARAL